MQPASRSPKYHVDEKDSGVAERGLLGLGHGLICWSVYVSVCLGCVCVCGWGVYVVARRPKTTERDGTGQLRLKGSGHL